jgi:hypothetical protein
MRLTLVDGGDQQGGWSVKDQERSDEQKPEQERSSFTTGVGSTEIPKEAKKEIALTVLRDMDADTQREVVRQLQHLPDENKKAIATSLMPTQPVTDWIWKVTVGVLATVFVIATLALCAGELWFDGDVQKLLTVVTTVAGILAGVISGRASAGGTPS